MRTWMFLHLLMWNLFASVSQATPWTWMLFQKSAEQDRCSISSRDSYDSDDRFSESSSISFEDVIEMKEKVVVRYADRFGQEDRCFEQLNPRHDRMDKTPSLPKRRVIRDFFHRIFKKDKK